MRKGQSMSLPTTSRRSFLKTLASVLATPLVINREGWTRSEERKPIRLGLIADLHHGLEPSAMERLERFLEAVDERKPDGILQMGDFNYGDRASDECSKLWSQFSGPRFHVLGNHDMDKQTKSGIVERWEMPDRYYSFDKGAWHFIVLDRNNLSTESGYVPYSKANFYVESKLRGHADPGQLEWLEADLEATDRPTAVFVHQGLGMQDEPYPPGDARAPIEKVLESSRTKEGTPKVVACFCGHHHIDRYNLKNGIHYVWINSASYYWVGGAYGRMAPYEDSLFAFATFANDGKIEIEGRRTDWSEPSPKERGYPNADELTTWISDRKLG